MEKEKILVIGASGFLGTALMQELSKKFEAIGTFHSNEKEGMIRFDLADLEQIPSVLDSVSPNIIVLAAAEVNVDAYEKDPEISKRQKASAEKIVDWCKANNSLLVFISTDFVFSDASPPFKETDVPNPINEYGKNKLEIEQIVSSLEKHLILRISTLYGVCKGKSFTQKFIGSTLQKLSRGESVEAAGDWVRSPTLTLDVAVALSRLLEKKQLGLFHASGNCAVSMYEIASAIAKEFNAPLELVKEGKGAELKLPARRPLNTSLDISKLQGQGISMRSFSQGIRFVHENM